MEEILASIRRIISEDEVPADAEAVPQVEEPDYEPMAVVQAEPEPMESIFDIEDDVLDLTEPYQAPEPEPVPVYKADDLEAYATVSPRPSPMPIMEEPIVSTIAEVAAASAFGHLAQTIAMPGQGRTLEDVVRELLRPMLKTWLDENLPTIVQATVDEEVSRISRRRL